MANGGRGPGERGAPPPQERRRGGGAELRRGRALLLARVVEKGLCLSRRRPNGEPGCGAITHVTAKPSRAGERLPPTHTHTKPRAPKGEPVLRTSNVGEPPSAPPGRLLRGCRGAASIAGFTAAPPICTPHPAASGARVAKRNARREKAPAPSRRAAKFAIAAHVARRSAPPPRPAAELARLEFSRPALGSQERKGPALANSTTVWKLALSPKNKGPCVAQGEGASKGQWKVFAAAALSRKSQRVLRRANE